MLIMEFFDEAQTFDYINRIKNLDTKIYNWFINNHVETFYYIDSPDMTVIYGEILDIEDLVSGAYLYHDLNGLIIGLFLQNKEDAFAIKIKFC